jgi:predicted anti-sigma-YlaC factor YlaD
MMLPLPILTAELTTTSAVVPVGTTAYHNDAKNSDVSDFASVAETPPIVMLVTTLADIQVATTTTLLAEAVPIAIAVNVPFVELTNWPW